MKFEKISDEKFQAFKSNEVLNPILISGGWIETDDNGTGPGFHDRYELTGKSKAEDNYQRTDDGYNYCQDNAISDS